MKRYSEKLKDPRWQRKRLEVLQRDNWTCKSCEATENTLHVHHRVYVRGAEPWEVPNDHMVTLCEDCHESETLNMPEALKELNEAIKLKFLSSDVSRLAVAFQNMQPVEVWPPFLVSAIHFWLTDKQRFQQMVDAYMDDMRNSDIGF